MVSLRHVKLERILSQCSESSCERLGLLVLEIISQLGNRSHDLNWNIWQVIKLLISENFAELSSQELEILDSPFGIPLVLVLANAF